MPVHRHCAQLTSWRQLLGEVTPLLWCNVLCSDWMAAPRWPGPIPVVFQLVHCYGATVIVRGIDTHSEADWWRSAGADVGQGEFLAPLAPPDEIAALLGCR